MCDFHGYTSPADVSRKFKQRIAKGQEKDGIAKGKETDREGKEKVWDRKRIGNVQQTDIKGIEKGKKRIEKRQQTDRKWVKKVSKRIEEDLIFCTSQKYK